MSHLMEPISVLPPVDASKHDDQCPFCCEDPVPSDLKSYIGKDNSSSKLENSLENNPIAPAPRRRFKHSTYPHDEFTSEPHHLLPGNEALKNHVLEMWLSTGAENGTYILSDTGFDINSYRNGVWLPSVPARFPKAAGWSKKNPEHKAMAFAVMEKESLQFHKGGHTNKGEGPDQCYIAKAKERLDDLNEYMLTWMFQACPEAKEKTSEKHPPPPGINDLVYQYVSAVMYQEISGHPRTWRIFISKLALWCHQENTRAAVHGIPDVG